ncbi:MAG: gliding motility-associated C-terminal domain-containing protein, partial [Cytophagales bacterium]|nr:gliding motility-associated C-terminal domain-containing protein [Cytophagales bacterium]
VTVYPIQQPSSSVGIISREYLCTSDDEVVTLKALDATAQDKDWFNTEYTWSTGEKTAEIDVVSGGTYTVQITHTSTGIPGSAGVTCTGSVSNPQAVVEYDVEVSIGAITPIDVDKGIESTTAVALETGGSKDYDSFVWTLADGTSLGTGKSVEIKLNETSQILVQATKEECFDSMSTTVLVFKPIEVPNAFTPNGDGIHDTWSISGLETYSEAVVKVYNRWGNLVYETYGGYDSDNEWNGTNNNNGGEVGMGAYYYVIDLNVEEREPVTGHVHIIR